MCSTPKAPKPPPMLPEAPRLADTSASAGSNAAQDTARRRRGAGGTILTGSRGVTDGAATAQKTLLGS